MAVPGFVAESTIERTTEQTYRARGRRGASRLNAVVSQSGPYGTKGSGRAGTVCLGTRLHAVYFDAVPDEGVVFYVGEQIGSCPRPTMSGGFPY
jgi:hypothetical protein